MSLDVDKLRALLDLLGEKEIAEFEYEDEKDRLKIVRVSSHAQQVVMAAPPSMMGAMPMAAMHASSAPSQASAPAASESSADTLDITSPFVGTFYRSPTPDAPPFVDVGSVVKTGQTLCIIEAMKLMNEIEAECAGTVVECYAQNGKAVEFGQKLFRIKRA
jgi:acetyl-CoA carboxylase biotin carboxyl carrier protein